MLFLPAMLALTSVVVLTPLASPVLPVQSPAVAAAVIVSQPVVYDPDRPIG